MVLLEVDAIYCISLKERDDRYNICCQELRRLGWLSQTYFFRPSRHSKSSHQGCYESHQAVIRLAQQRNQQYVLILEDDFFLDGMLNLQHLITFKQNPIADIFYLGHLPVLMWPVSLDGLFRCQSGLAHAYVINTKGLLAQEIANQPFSGTPIDILYLYKARAYTSVPMVAYQRFVSSDNEYGNFTLFKNWFYSRPKLISHGLELFWLVLLPLTMLL